MDAISDLLHAIDLSGVVFLRAELGEHYGIEMPPPALFHPCVKPLSGEHRLVMFHIVREGGGYLEVDGFAPEKLNEGDLVVVVAQVTHSVVDTPGRETISTKDAIAEHELPPVPPALSFGPGERTMRLVCGMLQFVERGFNPLFSALPAYLVIRRDDGPSSSWLQSNIAHLIADAESGRPGSSTLLRGQTELLFAETLRAYLQKLPPTETGWLAAQNDPLVGKALRYLHAEPARPWTLATLAKAVGTSRSALAASFSEVLEVPPMTYLTRWRIRLATNLLTQPEHTIAEVAERVGYQSESAFCRAFKREIGVPPATWRTQATPNRAAPEANV